MPQFSASPPPNSKGYGLPLLRTPANGKLIVAITCNEMIGCPTHWYTGRTVPCEQENCEACANGFPWRWHGYLSVMLQQARRHALLELTAQAAEQVVEYGTTHGSLRGTILTAQRHRNRHNGRVLLQLQPGDLDRLNLPEPPNIQAALAVIWNVPLAAEPSEDRTRGMHRIQQPDDNHKPIDFSRVKQVMAP